MVVVVYLIFIVSLCHFNCLVAFIKSYLVLSYKLIKQVLQCSHLIHETCGHLLMATYNVNRSVEFLTILCDYNN